MHETTLTDVHSPRVDLDADTPSGQPTMSATAATAATEGPAAGPLLSLRGVSKSFGSVRALTDVDLDVPRGRVTALTGDNGAGKSVLIKTISGLWEPDHGQILWEGRPVRLRRPKDAENLGITTIYQDLALCDNLDVIQNMSLGHEPTRFAMLDEATMETNARRTLDELSVTTLTTVRQLVGSLSGGQRQTVAVAKAVMSHAKLVIMDEPTAALGVSQTKMVLELISSLASRGVAVIVISHNLNDVFDVADQIAVLYLGRLVACRPVGELDRQAVVEYMTTGQAQDHADRPELASPEAPSLELVAARA
jgi:ABC-type sugar transport system ATPase subunit